VLSLVRITKRYGNLSVLNGFDLEVPAGSTTGIAGPSGAGKSTLARIMTLHEPPESGSVLLDGRPASLLARRQLQLVLQDPADSFHPRWPVWRIAAEAWRIAEGPKNEHRSRAAELIERVNLSQRVLDRRACELSGGERRRLALARALAAAPRLLVLDETLTGLEEELQLAMLRLLREWQARDGVALAIVSHQRSLIRSCERVVTL
jgi:ABC-type dipeptide/oligopeptide/nickel transport system ATPase subunit